MCNGGISLGMAVGERFLNRSVPKRDWALARSKVYDDGVYFERDLSSDERPDNKRRSFQRGRKSWETDPRFVEVRVVE